MKVIRFAEKNWRPDDRTLISTGDYRIPEDMTPELARRAVEEGAAVVVVSAEPAPAPSAAAKKPRGGAASS